MDFTVDWVFPVGLGILGTLFMPFSNGKLKPPSKNQKEPQTSIVSNFYIYIPVG